MSGFPRPNIPNDMQWNHRVPYNPQGRPFFRPRAPFRPRDRGPSSYRAPIQEDSHEHWCETCDRGFPNEDLLSRHNQQHQKCNIDGCQFVAHPKVITKHIQMQHSSGLYKKIAKLNNPEEIEKWREERRKKYPTKTNIDNKAAALKEKIERGEKMNLDRKEWHGRRDNDQNRHANSGQETKGNYNTTNNNQPESKRRKRTQPRKPKDLPQTEEKRTLAPFAGIQSLGIDIIEESEEDLSSNDLIEDEEIETNNTDLVLEIVDTSKIIEKPVVCSALSSLMCDYGTSDEEMDAIGKPSEGKKNGNVGKSHNMIKENDLWRKKENISQQTNVSNKPKKDLAKEFKNIKEFGRNIQEMTMSQDNSVSKDVSSEIRQSQNDKGDLIKYNVKIIDHSSSNKSDLTAENGINPSDSGNKTTELTLNKNGKPASSEKTNPKPCEDDDDSGPEEVKVDKHAVTTANVVEKNNTEDKAKTERKKFEVVKRKPFFRKPKPKIPSTLIYKLLSKEMKQERNQVLQCIRYIRLNNYFEKSSS